MKHDLAAPNWRPFARRLVLLGAPLTLGALEIFHPVGQSMDIVAELSPHLSYWLILHVLQLPLFGLMALAGIFAGSFWLPATRSQTNDCWR